MTVITMRNLDDDIQKRLKVRAAAHGRSMEAEARDILTAAVSSNSMIVDWIEAARDGLDIGPVDPWAVS